MKHPLSFGIGDCGIRESLHAVAGLRPFKTDPAKVEVDDASVTEVSRWVEALSSAQRAGRARWTLSWTNHRTTKIVSLYPASKRVTAQMPEAFSTIAEGIGWIEALPFDVCSIGTIYPDEWNEMQVDPFGFSSRHMIHGWACAFRSAGHDRLVSRRWLEFGPWRVHHQPRDLSVVQFHDLRADAQTAARQARPGHERMGISEIGGYLQQPYVFSAPVEGLYIAEHRTLEVVVPPGGKIDQLHMQDACAVRQRHHVAPATEKPVDQVAYVFVDEDDARAHLHELWLRDLEVWLVDGSGRRRLDDTYAPTPRPPKWVLEINDRADG